VRDKLKAGITSGASRGSGILSLYTHNVSLRQVSALAMALTLIVLPGRQGLTPPSLKLPKPLSGALKPSGHTLQIPPDGLAGHRTSADRDGGFVDLALIGRACRSRPAQGCPLLVARGRGALATRAAARRAPRAPPGGWLSV
jgi:hypothetical protein